MEESYSVTKIWNLANSCIYKFLEVIWKIIIGNSVMEIYIYFSWANNSYYAEKWH